MTSLAFASAPDDLIGFWKTFDLKNNPRTILKFYKIDEEYRADVTEILENKNNAKIGVTIIHGLKFADKKWTQGEVLDTDSGKTYDCMIRLSEDGKRMYFRAYIKSPLLGRTLTWERVTA